MIVRFLRHVALIAAFFFLNLYLFSQTTVYQKDKWGAKLYYVDETNTMRIKSGKYEILYGSSSLDKDLKKLTVSF